MSQARRCQCDFWYFLVAFSTRIWSLWSKRLKRIIGICDTFQKNLFKKIGQSPIFSTVSTKILKKFIFKIFSMYVPIRAGANLFCTANVC
jgi:hypothetical protein